jgi:hypothetical protein
MSSPMLLRSEVRSLQSKCAGCVGFVRLLQGAEEMQPGVLPASVQMPMLSEVDPTIVGCFLWAGLLIGMATHRVRRSSHAFEGDYLERATCQFIASAGACPSPTQCKAQQWIRMQVKGLKESGACGDICDANEGWSSRLEDTLSAYRARWSLSQGFASLRCDFVFSRRAFAAHSEMFAAARLDS